MTKSSLALNVLVVPMALLGGSVMPATAVTLAAFDQGTVHSSLNGGTVGHDPDSTVMTVELKREKSCVLGHCFYHGTIWRSYALFEIPAYLGDVNKVVLQLVATPSTFPWRPISVYSVSSPAASFSLPYAGESPEGIALMEDLGDGATYAASSLYAGDSLLSMQLSATALADLNASRGDVFAIGLSKAEIGQGVLIQSVELQVSPVPEPGPHWLWLFGAAFLAMRRPTAG